MVMNMFTYTNYIIVAATISTQYMKISCSNKGNTILFGIYQCTVPNRFYYLVYIHNFAQFTNCLTQHTNIPLVWNVIFITLKLDILLSYITK